MAFMAQFTGLRASPQGLFQANCLLCADLSRGVQTLCHAAIAKTKENFRHVGVTNQSRYRRELTAQNIKPGVDPEYSCQKTLLVLEELHFQSTWKQNPNFPRGRIRSYVERFVVRRLHAV